MIEEKRNKIKNSLRITRERRKTQDVIILKLKIDNDKLNNNTIKALNTIFLEAKWLYNYVINKEFNNDIFNIDPKIKNVNVYVKDHYETRKLNYLSSQMKEEIINRAMDNIRGLHKLKENGFKVGKLKFKSFITSIPLNQYTITYKIINNNYIKIQNIKQLLKVNGLDNLECYYEPASALLINNNNNYYINITAYKNKYILEKPVNNQKIISFDLGIKNQLTCSNGSILNYNIPKSKKEIRLQRSLSRKAKYAEGTKKLSRGQSRNYYKNKNKLNKEQNKTMNRRKDTINKITHYLTSNYDIVITQNDNIRGWKHLFGRKIESTGIGGIIDALKHKASTLILLDKFIPTTKECSNCHNKYDIKLDERIYQCHNCGFIIDRDYNSALNDMYYGIKKLNELLKIKNKKLNNYFKKYNINLNVPMERRELTPVEIIASGFEGLNISPYVKLSMVSEAGSLYALA
ncbi:RNA-guided endonuclease InsQ/TnpB family protein [Ferroplasma acidiphilum]|uniref:RNA-guided endonuclease InsQ/TnpB family protein n=1 Tax=Ferroplasma acidiphilum TaxID=74969 RepID=UPI0028156A5C|nr:transposase [Ferroplasma acidiphilum]WMT53658.1 MAG: transposase [Ferroplasma acidiphilum]